MRQLRSLLALLRSIRGGPGHNGPPSDHFDGRRFFNEHAPAGRSLADVIRWQRTAQRKPWPDWVENRARPALPAQLTQEQIARQYARYNSSQALDKPTQELLASILDTIEAPAIARGDLPAAR